MTNPIQGDRGQETGDSKTLRFWRLLSPVSCLLAAVAFVGGCQQKMAEQPYYKPYEHSDFFKDGRSARPLEAGVVHRGQSFQKLLHGKLISPVQIHRSDLLVKGALFHRQMT